MNARAETMAELLEAAAVDFDRMATALMAVREYPDLSMLTGFLPADWYHLGDVAVLDAQGLRNMAGKVRSGELRM